MKKCCGYIEEFKVSGTWNEFTTTGAAFYGHLDCLKYAHENGCPWDKHTTSFAARTGQLECLKYVHEKGCPWHKDTIAEATKQGHLDCFKYSLENECPWDEQTTLTNLEKHASKIDLDDMWWRTFLADKDLTNYTSLQTLVNSKKEEIK